MAGMPSRRRQPEAIYIGRTGISPVCWNDGQYEAVSEFISAGEQRHAGWPGGHCLRVPKEQEGLFRGR